jgi:nucleotide-binding universal stress UspA family protein
MRCKTKPYRGGTEMIDYPKYKKVLFCTDFSENSDWAFHYAFGIAKRDEGVLYILHVIPANPDHYNLERFLAKAELDRMKATLREKIIRYSPIPVFIIPCKEKQDHDES